MTLFINPQVNELAAAAGTGSPVSLGGSTGGLIGLLDGDVLTVSVYYNGEPTVDTSTVTLSTSNFTSATDPMPATGIPTQSS